MDFCSSLDMMDKVEPPVIPDGYGISVAYACLLDIIRSISMLVSSVEESREGASTPPPTDNRGQDNENRLNAQLINSSWCGLLAALSPLIDARYTHTLTSHASFRVNSWRLYKAQCTL